jgi:hypothetical protein
MTNNFSHQAFFFPEIPNCMKRKHPRMGEKKKQWERTKVQASKTAQKRQATWRKGNHLRA